MLLLWSAKMLERESDRQISEKYHRDISKLKPGLSKRLTLSQEALVRSRVVGLPRAERLVVYLRFWENSSIVDIAGSLGISKELTMKLIQTALARLRGELRSIVPGHSKSELKFAA